MKIVGFEQEQEVRVIAAACIAEAEALGFLDCATVLAEEGLAGRAVADLRDGLLVVVLGDGVEAREQLDGSWLLVG